VSFSTFWHAKGGLQMCVFLGRAMNFFGPSLGGWAIAPPRPRPRGSAAALPTAQTAARMVMWFGDGTATSCIDK